MQRAVNISFFRTKGLNNIKTERGEKNLFTNRVVKNITYLQKKMIQKKGVCIQKVCILHTPETIFQKIFRLLKSPLFLLKKDPL